jgi:hypothetical protein
MPKFHAKATAEGGLEMSDYQRKTLKQYNKDNTGSRMCLVIDKETPESRNQRKMYHGAYLPLWAFLDGKNYKDHQVLEDLHEVAKLEFNPTVVIVNGKDRKIGKSTKGKLNQGFMERFLDNLVENYGIDPSKVLNTDHYKDFRDRIWPFTTKYDTYIDYLLDMKILTSNQKSL